VLNLDRANNRFTYAVAELVGGTRTWWFDYTVADSNGDTATARATVRVGECRPGVWCTAAAVAAHAQLLQYGCCSAAWSLLYAASLYDI
jgi:hypothetical protein